MTREDTRSRKAARGLCHVTQRDGNICTNVKGECCVHAPEESRCTSTLEDDLTLRCWGFKEHDSEYCNKHLDFPNLGIRAKEYGTECHQRAEPCSLHDFLERFYPARSKDSYPRRPEEFLTYVKRMCGHDDLWELTVPAPELVAYVKNIVDMLLSSREAPRRRHGFTFSR